MVEYRREVPPDPIWTRKAYELQLKRKITATLVIDGESKRLLAQVECPRCGGMFAVDSDSTGVYVGGGYLDQSTSDAERSLIEDGPVIEAVCCAGPPVDGTPQGKLGCGATFNVWARTERRRTQC